MLVCECPCHCIPETERRRALDDWAFAAAHYWAQEKKGFAGVPLDDPVSTVLACARCRASHYPPPTWTDRSEGTSGCWEEDEGG